MRLTGIRVIVVSMLSCFALSLFTMVSSDAATIPRDPNDLLVMAGHWWGMSIEDFPSAAGLQSNEYAIGDDPSAVIDPNMAGVKDIVPSLQQSKWSPPELNPLAFRFKPGQGLYQIVGFYHGTFPEMVAAMTRVYGRPGDSATCIGLGSFEWLVGESILGITSISWSIVPRSKGGFRTPEYTDHPCH
jgi:hypothetical protein